MNTSNELKKTSDSFSTKKTLNNSNKLLIGALTLVLVAGMAIPAFALTIDNFDSGATDITSNSTFTTGSDTDAGLPASETLGEVRNTVVDWVSGGLDVMANVNPPVGIMAFSSDSSTDGIFTLTYDAGGAGLGGEDLTIGGNADRIVVDLVSADLGSAVTVSITDTSGDTVSKTLMTAGGAETLIFLFASMLGTGDATTPTDADKIEVKLVGVFNGDYEIDLIGIPQMKVGGTVGSMSTTSLLVAGAQANMGLWSMALVGVVAAGAAIVYKKKSKKTEQ